MLAHGLRLRLFIHGRPSTLAPCPDVVQSVIVTPTPLPSREHYALCPVLIPSVRPHDFRPGVSVPSRKYALRPGPCFRLWMAFLHGAVSPFGLNLTASHHEPLPYSAPGAHSCGFCDLSQSSPVYDGLPCYGRLAFCQKAFRLRFRVSSGAAWCRFVPFLAMLFRAVADCQIGGLFLLLDDRLSPSTV